MKWIIAQCSVFAGARTHSTIAALSSGVPTLSIGYSLKARGINRDIYGHLDHCLPVARLSPNDFRTRIADLIYKEAEIRAHLLRQAAVMRTRALSAGTLLRRICGRYFGGFEK
jgi:polysaccharide pyruvyl transferase WcaK-like protein